MKRLAEIIKPYLRLLRVGNLCFIAILLYVIEKWVATPLLHVAQFTEQMPWWVLLLLIVSTVLIAAGGYVINDPVIEAHGCVFADGDTEADMRAVVNRSVDNYDYANGTKAELALAVRKSVRNYFFRKTKQAPLIVVSVLEV